LLGKEVKMNMENSVSYKRWPSTRALEQDPWWVPPCPPAEAERPGTKAFEQPDTMRPGHETTVEKGKGADFNASGI
jgi:hypothetical protein